MTALEFIKFRPDWMTKSFKRAELAFDSDVLAMKAKESIKDYKNDSDYNETLDLLYDVTMSCDKQKAIDWARYYMKTAIVYGLDSQNLDWKTKFLAAHDLLEALTA